MRRKLLQLSDLGICFVVVVRRVSPRALARGALPNSDSWLEVILENLLMMQRVSLSPMNVWLETSVGVCVSSGEGRSA